MEVPADIRKSFARGLKTEIENSANKVIPGTGEKISALNDEVGPLIEVTKKIIPTEVQKDATKNAFTAIDGLVLGDVLHNPLAIGSFAFKKAADLANTPLGRTYLGNAMTAVGKYGKSDALLRRELIHLNNPWSMLDEKR